MYNTHTHTHTHEIFHMYMYIIIMDYVSAPGESRGKSFCFNKNVPQHHILDNNNKIKLDRLLIE